MWSGDLGKFNATKHIIQLVDDVKPVYEPLYWAGPNARAIQKKEVQKMQEAGVIEPSTAECANPVVLVP